MTYLRVEWIHSFDSEPVELLSELDTTRYEIRKVERFRNGILSFAGPAGASGMTILSEKPIPSTEQIGADLQFHVVAIDRETFEHAWQAALISAAA